MGPRSRLSSDGRLSRSMDRKTSIHILDQSAKGGAQAVGNQRNVASQGRGTQVFVRFCQRVFGTMYNMGLRCKRSITLSTNVQGNLADVRHRLTTLSRIYACCKSGQDADNRNAPEFCTPSFGMGNGWIHITIDRHLTIPCMLQSPEVVMRKIP